MLREGFQKAFARESERKSWFWTKAANVGCPSRRAGPRNRCRASRCLGKWKGGGRISLQILCGIPFGYALSEIVPVLF